MNKLRFVGETEPWAIKSLEDLGSITTGSTPSRQNPKYWNNGDIPWVSVSDFGYKYVYDTEFLISKEGADVSRIVPPNSILVNCIGAIGKMAMTRTHCATNQQINAFTPNLGNDANFSYYAIAKNIHQLDRLTTKSVLSQVNKTSFSSMTIPLPSLPEQEKIGGFLSALDEEIERQSELVDLLALEYKGYSQRIFSQQLRFKDENGEDYPEWGEKNLEDLFNHNKTSGITKSNINPHGKNKCFLYGEMYSDFRTIINYVKNRTDVVMGHLTVSPCIVMPASGESGKEIARASVINESNVILGGDLNILAPRSSSLDLPFMAYSINHSSINKQISLMSQGSSIFHLNWKDIKKLKIQVPCLNEQKKIGTFLEKLELRLETERVLLTQLREQKKAYLQKLLP